MKPASLHEIKNELYELEPRKLIDLCLRLAKYKNDNKELLSYLLFHSSNEDKFINEIKKEVENDFKELPKPNLYHTKKSLRKILRSLNKYIKHIGSKKAEAELLIHFCGRVKETKIPIHSSLVLGNLYAQQIKKLNKAVASLDEDLQYDYLNDIAKLTQ